MEQNHPMISCTTLSTLTKVATSRLGRWCFSSFTRLCALSCYDQQRPILLKFQHHDISMCFFLFIHVFFICGFCSSCSSHSNVKFVVRRRKVSFSLFPPLFKYLLLFTSTLFSGLYQPTISIVGSLSALLASNGFPVLLQTLVSPDHCQFSAFCRFCALSPGLHWPLSNIVGSLFFSELPAFWRLSAFHPGL